jgi:hypothetical protein
LLCFCFFVFVFALFFYGRVGSSCSTCDNLCVTLVTNTVKVMNEKSLDYERTSIPIKRCSIRLDLLFVFCFVNVIWMSSHILASITIFLSDDVRVVKK